MSEVQKSESETELEHNEGKRKRNELSNARKIEVIQLAQEGKSQRQLAAEFGVSKSQVQSILQRKDDIIYRQQNEGEDSVPPRKKTNFDDVNERVLDWYLQAKARGITVTGAYLQQKAREIGRELGKDYFRGSNGWLEAFKKRHKALFGEGKTPVHCTPVKEMPPQLSLTITEKRENSVSQKPYTQNITEGFQPRDVFFACETGLLYHSVPEPSFFNSGRLNDPRSNDRLTVLLCTNMLGHREQAFVVGRHTKHAVFRNIDIDCLPVEWSVHSRSLMTADLFLSWLRRFNDRIRKQDRRILLFLENTPVHVDVKLSNIVVRFFRETETNRVHALHTGLTQEFKMQYRIRVLRYLLARGVMQNGQATTGQDTYDKITQLNAVYWISSSWDSAKTKVIQDCFTGAGFPPPFMKNHDRSTYGAQNIPRPNVFSPFGEFTSPVSSPTQRTPTFITSKEEYTQVFSAVCQISNEIDLHELSLRYVSADDALPTYDLSENAWEGPFTHKRDDVPKSEPNEVYENGKETVHLCLLNSFEEVDETLRQLQDYAQEHNSPAFLHHIMKARDSLVDDVWEKQNPHLRLDVRRDVRQDEIWRGEQYPQSATMDYMLERASFAVSPPVEPKSHPNYESVDALFQSHSTDTRMK